MNVSLCARAKILTLLDDGKAFRIQASVGGGSHVDLILNSEKTEFDCIIATIPLIVADISTVTLTAGRSIDFDYRSGEFLISSQLKVTTMATFAINIEFIVDAPDQDSAESASKQIIEAAKMEDLIERGTVQDIEMLDDDEGDLDFDGDDE